MKKWLAIVLIVRFYPLLLGKALFFGDNYSLLVPGKIFTAFWLKRGVIPLWNPMVFGGIPWIGDINQSLFSFSTIFFTLLQPVNALNFTILFYCILSFVGMYSFSRRYLHSDSAASVSALIWVLSSGFSTSLNNIAVLQSIACVPWILLWGCFYWKERKGLLLTAVSLTVMLCGGYPQFIPYTVLLVVFFSLDQKNWKQWIKRWFAIGILSLGLSAAAWIPFMHTIQDSTRSIQTADQMNSGRIHYQDVMSFVLPTFFVDPQSGIKWGPSWDTSASAIPYIPWIGIVVGLFLFIGRLQTRNDYHYLALIGISLFLSCIPVLSYIPILKASRGPQLALLMADVSVAVWMGDLVKRRQSIQLPNRSFIIGSFFILIVFLIGILGLRHFDFIWSFGDRSVHHALSTSSFHTMERDHLIVRHLFELFLVHALLLVGSMFFWKQKNSVPLIALLMVELQLSTSAFIFFAPSSIYPKWNDIDARTPLTRTLINNGNQPYTDFATYWDSLILRKPFSDSYVDEKERTTFSRLISMRKFSTPDWNMVNGVNSLNGYVAFIPQDVNARWNAKEDPAINFLPEIKISPSRFFDWGVTTVRVDPFFPHAQDRQATGLQPTSRFRLPDTPFLSNVSETPNRQEIAVENVTSKTVLYVADRYDLDWTATVNGKKVVIGNENGIRSIPLEPGASTIILSYWPRSLTLGLIVTSVTLSGYLSIYGFSKLLANRHHRHTYPSTI